MGDIANSALKGIQAGGNAVVGFGGDMQNLIGNVAEYGMSKFLHATGLAPATAPDSSYSQIAAENAKLTGGGGLPSSSDLLNAENALTKATVGQNTNYTPQTGAGGYAKSIGAFVPAAVLTGGASAGNLVRQALIPGAASEAAGQAARGTALEPLARMAAAVTAGGAAGMTTLPGAVDTQLAQLAANASPADFAAAQQAMASAKAAGIDLTPAEALDHVTGGATTAGSAMRLAERLPEGRAIHRAFLRAAARPGL